jgi:predicted DNA-binding transcriptional regulator AlpA
VKHLDHITLLDRHQVAKLLGIRVWTLDKWVKSGQFPRAVELSPKTYRWSVSTVSTLIERKAREPRKPRALRGRAALLAKPKPKIVRIRF